VHVIVGSNHVAVIDTGFDESARDVVIPYIEQLGVSDDSIRFLIITHSDFDHSGGAVSLRNRFASSLVCAGERDRPMLESLQKMIDERYGEFASDHGFDETEETKEFIRNVTKETVVDIGFTGGERIDLGGRVIEVIHSPGHSWGHLSILDETTNMLVIGDAVLSNSVLESDGTPAFPPTYRYVEAYRATIRALKARANIGILPAHYPPNFGSAAADFYDVSLAYTDLVEAVTFETVAEANAPVSLLEIIEKSHERLGVWDRPAYEYLCYPVLGHLEVLESYGKVVSGRRSDERIAWKIP
jgi:glyoxylase-like metal-dependent hydrolase (beta-lactamase superfamily II)